MFELFTLSSSRDTKPSFCSFALFMSFAPFTSEVIEIPQPCQLFAPFLWEVVGIPQPFIPRWRQQRVWRVQRQGMSAQGWKGMGVQQWKCVKAWWWKSISMKGGGVYIIHINMFKVRVGYGFLPQWNIFNYPPPSMPPRAYEIPVFNHPPGRTGFDFNCPPLVMVNRIAVLVMVTNCKGWQNLQVLSSLLQSVA